MKVLTRWMATCLAVAAVSGSATARAAVVYVDFVPDRVVGGSTFIFDVDNDGTKDLLFDQQVNCLGNCDTFATVGGLGGQVLVTPAGPPNYITPLSAGTTIGPGSSTWGSSGLFAEDRFFGTPPTTFFEDGLWDNGLTAFLGFSFLIGADLHYGWARLNIEETNNTITIFDYAYESTAGTPIRAGSVPEPGSLALVAIGVAALLRKRHAARRR